jgi:hypothetical protein
MFYAKSLRAIGQSLEMLRIDTFEIEKEGYSYVVRSKSLSPTSQWIFRNSIVERMWDSPGAGQNSIGTDWLRYDCTDISWLDTQGRKSRRSASFGQMREASGLSQLLRNVGEHLDRIEASDFKISWTPDSVSVEYHIPAENRERKGFTAEKLHELGLHSRFRRSHRNTFPAEKRVRRLGCAFQKFPGPRDCQRKED